MEVVDALDSLGYRPDGRWSRKKPRSFVIIAFPGHRTLRITSFSRFLAFLDRGGDLAFLEGGPTAVSIGNSAGLTAPKVTREQSPCQRSRDPPPAGRIGFLAHDAGDRKSIPRRNCRGFVPSNRGRGNGDIGVGVVGDRDLDVEFRAGGGKSARHRSGTLAALIVNVSWFLPPSQKIKNR